MSPSLVVGVDVVRSARRAVERRAIAWLVRHRRWMDPANVDESRTMLSRKALIEVALLIGLRVRTDPRLSESGYQELLDTVASVARRNSYRELVLRDRRAFLLYAATYAALKLCERDDQEFRGLLEMAVRGRYATFFERLPYRQLDLLHTLELAGIPHQSPPMQDILPLTLAVQPVNIYELQASDYYAITHTIYYATDFGRRFVVWPETTDAREIVERLHALLFVSMGRDDADLVGELLLAMTCMRSPKDELTEHAWLWLQAHQQPDGRIPGPDGVVPQSLVDEDPDWGAWATAYHTTVVAALASLTDRAVSSNRDLGDLKPTDDVPKIIDALRGISRWLLDQLGEIGADRILITLAASMAADCVGDHGIVRMALEHLATDIDSGTVSAEGRGADVLFGLVIQMKKAGVTCPTLLKMAKDASEYLVLQPDATQGLAMARELLGELGMISGREFPSTFGQDELDSDPLSVSRKLIAQGKEPSVSRDVAIATGAMLSSAMAEAVSNYDLCAVALLLRGLTRLPGAPTFLLSDAASFLVSQRMSDGSIGVPAIDNPGERRELAIGWTVAAVISLYDYLSIRRSHEGLR